jgi:hypothetical protein
MESVSTDVAFLIHVRALSKSARFINLDATFQSSSTSSIKYEPSAPTYILPMINRRRKLK